MLLVLLFVKHYVADFLFQTDWMVKGKGAEKDWAFPLFCHAAIHGVLTIILVGLYTMFSPETWLFSHPQMLCVIGWGEIAVHFIIDRIKASPFILHDRFKDPTKKPFWNALGADQLAHALTYLAIAYIVT